MSAGSIWLRASDVSGMRYVSRLSSASLLLRISDMFESIINKIKSIGQKEMVNCTACKREYDAVQFADNYMVCPDCGKYHRMDARTRIEMLRISGRSGSFSRDIRAGISWSFRDTRRSLRRRVRRPERMTRSSAARQRSAGQSALYS